MYRDREFGFYDEPRVCTCGVGYAERGAYWRCRLSHERDEQAAEQHLLGTSEPTDE